ncbi:MAG TPA: hypothetical protein PLC80_15790 [Draconibacterium sp.]|jgi:hypothetical protein|nr:hypothetical protein [Draconibacterium sp.]
MSTFYFEALNSEQVSQCDESMAIMRGLVPQTDALSGNDRVSMRKLDIRAQNFARDAINWSKDVPALASPFVDIEAMESSLLFHEQMVRFGASLESLTRYVNDLAMVSGSQVEDMARACYQGIKIAAKHRVPGASTAYAMLKTRYKGYGRKGSAEPTETEPANPTV